MKVRIVALAVIMTLVTFLMGCSGGSQSSSSTESGSGLEPAQIDPVAPADKASETVDDANESTNDTTYEIQELTDSE